MKEITGELEFFSETGTEGGYWTLYDTSKQSYVAPTYGIFTGRNVWDADDPSRHGKTTASRHEDGRPLPDPMQTEEDYFVSSLFCGQIRGDRDADGRLMERYGFRIVYSEEIWDDRFGPGNWHYEEEDGHEDRQTVVGPDGTRYTSGGTPRTEPHRPYGVSSAERTVVTVVWDDGEIEEGRLSDTLLVLRRDYEGLVWLENGDHLTVFDKFDPQNVVWSGEIDLVELDLFTEAAFGMWIHHDQRGVERDVWASWFMEEYPAVVKRGEKDEG